MIDGVDVDTTAFASSGLRRDLELTDSKDSLTYVPVRFWGGGPSALLSDGRESILRGLKTGVSPPPRSLSSLGTLEGNHGPAYAVQVQTAVNIEGFGSGHYPF